MQVFRVRGNSVTELDLNYNLKRLQILDLSGNALAGAVPQGISAASSIISVDLSNNALTQMPRTWDSGATGAVRLHVLNLSNNQITVRDWTQRAMVCCA